MESMIGARVTNMDGVDATVSNIIKHPGYNYYGSSREFDIALFELSSNMPVSFTVNPNEPTKGDVEQIAGFSSFHGGNLKQTNTKAFGIEFVGGVEVGGSYRLHSDKRIEGEGWNEPGDSGGACYNKQGVWGVIMGAALYEDPEDHLQQDVYQNGCNSIFHPDTKTWLLESINSWSYPAEVKGEGSVTIKVQSLHQGGEVFIPTALNGLEIESNSCETNSTVPPFGICEVVVKGSGQLSLGGDNLVEVNKPVVVPPQPEENGGNGGGDSGGGAAGWLALLGLGALVARRRPH